MDQSPRYTESPHYNAIQAAKYLRRLRKSIPKGWQKRASEATGIHRVRLSNVLNGASVLEKVAQDAPDVSEYEE